MNSHRPAFIDRILTDLQRLLPQHLLSRLMLWLTRRRIRVLKNAAIRQFIRLFDVNLAEAEKKSPDEYENFNAFFTRALADGARPIVGDVNAIACPVDGTLSQIGQIHGDRLLQAKGFSYGLASLLGGDRALKAKFENGSFATIYLAPGDYHRVHLPESGRLRSMVYVPGRLFSVNDATTRHLKGVFTRNERVLCLFDTDLGPMAVVLVGALCVGCIDTVWADRVTPAIRRKPRRWTYPHEGPGVLRFERGEEIGRFNNGSTVIVLFAENKIHWTEKLGPGDTVRVGQRLATRINSY